MDLESSAAAMRQTSALTEDALTDLIRAEGVREKKKVKQTDSEGTQGWSQQYPGLISSFSLSMVIHQSVGLTAPVCGGSTSFECTPLS